jgi:hypothetical protein
MPPQIPPETAGTKSRLAKCVPNDVAFFTLRPSRSIRPDIGISFALARGRDIVC